MQLILFFQELQFNLNPESWFSVDEHSEQCSCGSLKWNFSISILKKFFFFNMKKVAEVFRIIPSQ